MLLSNVCRVAMMPIKTTMVSSTLMRSPQVTGFLKIQSNGGSNIVRGFKMGGNLNNNDRHFLRRAKERVTLKDRAMAPSQGTAIGIGQGAVMGAAVFGLGALAYYGLGMSAQPGTLEYSVMWPSYVKERIHSAYGYFGGSCVVTALSAAAAFRSPVMMNLMMKNSWLVIGGTLAAMIGTGMVVRSIPYQPGFGAKQLGWLAHSGVMGVVIAPMCMMGGPLLMRAAMMTAGVVGGLSTIAVCAPSEKFLNMGGPLAIGLGVVFASSLASMFVPPATALGSGLFAVSMYGGLILFSGFLLYDTQKIIKYAEALPPNQVFDPVNASMSIYMDTLNIFIRIAQMLAMSNSRRK